MILNRYGNPIGTGRYGEQIDGFQLPDGAVICKTASLALHRRIQNDPILRERLETAQKIIREKTGNPKFSFLHLELLKHENKNITPEVTKAIEKNLDFGEKIQRQRIDNEKLKESGKGYENIKAA
jgi:hypothetical protein